MNLRDLMYAAVGLVTAPWWARKHRGGWQQRLGRSFPSIPPADRKRVLLHAVSVGEVNALRTLVPLLLEHVDVVVSTTTDTGLARARDLFAPQCNVVRFPLDFSWGVRRFLDAVRPDVVGLVELEIWPNFVAACTKRGTPVCVINGRLSERSFKGYRRIRPLVRTSFAAIAHAGVQDEAYRDRFIAMGTPEDRCTVTGSMKWDAVGLDADAHAAEHLAEAMGIDRSRPLIVAGSTAPGEDALLHKACPEGVQLLCAPRKPEWFADAATALPGVVRRSEPESPRPHADRFLLDTIGELRLAYSLATLVVIGRSFGTLYGSDPLEPAALGKAVIIGPAIEDFRGAVETLAQAGGIVQTTPDELERELRRLLSDESARHGLGEAARECVLANRGASERHAALLRRFLGKSPAEHPPSDDDPPIRVATSLVGAPVSGDDGSSRSEPSA